MFWNGRTRHQSDESHGLTSITLPGHEQTQTPPGVLHGVRHTRHVLSPFLSPEVVGGRAPTARPLDHAPHRVVGGTLAPRGARQDDVAAGACRGRVVGCYSNCTTRWASSPHEVMTKLCRNSHEVLPKGSRQGHKTRGVRGTPHHGQVPPFLSQRHPDGACFTCGIPVESTRQDAGWCADSPDPYERDTGDLDGMTCPNPHPRA